MKTRLVIGFALAGSLTCAGLALAQSAPAGGLEVVQFKPGFDDAMTMMVQPRHIKLYAAGDAGNWDLAAFQLRELRGAFRRIGQYLPKYRDKSLDESIANIMNPSLQATDDAIKARDTKAFATAYANLTDGCNACHNYMEHSFLVMKVPTGAAAQYPDQDFKTH
jgi:hypothetical protein